MSDQCSLADCGADANIANVYLTAHESANFGQLEAGFYGGALHS